MKKPVIADRLRPQNERPAWLVPYSLGFAVLTLLVFSWFWFNGASFIWRSDGSGQHFPFFVYYGKYLRTIVRTLFTEHRLVLPLWDMNVGFGADIIQTLSYYGIGDPFTFLSILCPVRFAEEGYTVLILLRLYCAGGAFLLLCRKMRQPRTPSVLGALLYTYCGYSLCAAPRHPYFINPMITLPLLVIAVEWVFENRRYWAFALLVAIAALSNFYFFYIQALALVLYVVFRYFDLFGREGLRFRRFLHYLPRFALPAITGLCAAGVTFLPSVLAMLGTDRFDIDILLPAWNTDTFYWGFFPSLIGAAAHGDWTCLCYTFIVVPAVVVLFMNREHPALKIAFVLFTVMLLIPFFGSVWNGFSYYTNRFVLVYSLLVCYMIVCAIPQLLKLEFRHKLGIVLVTVAGCIALLIYKKTAGGQDIPALLLLVLGVAVLLLLQEVKIPMRVRYAVLSLALVVSIAANAMLQYAPDGGNYIKQFVPLTEGVSFIKSPYAKKMVKAFHKEEDWYRVDAGRGNSTTICNNYGMANDIPGTFCYFSLTNPLLTRFLMDELQANCATNNRTIYGLDARAHCTALFNARYFLTPLQENAWVPHGFTNRLYKVKNYELYENPDALPFGYTYDHVIDRATYEAMTPVEKQQALLQGVVTDDPAALAALPAAKVSYTHHELPYTVEKTDGVVPTENGFITYKENATITLSFEENTNEELYVWLQGLYFDGEDQRDPPLKVRAKCDLISRTATLPLRGSFTYSDTHNVMINLGRTGWPREKLTLRFSREGPYRCAGISLLAQPFTEFDDQVTNLAQYTLQNVEMQNDAITGSLTLPETRLVCLSVPYSDGWQAAIDGESAPVLQVNTCMMGLVVPPGEHAVTFTYRPAYRPVSLACSAVGAAGIGAVALLPYLRRRKKTPAGELPVN